MPDAETLSAARVALMCRRCLAEIEHARADARTRLIQQQALARSLLGRRRVLTLDKAAARARRHPGWELIACLHARQELTARDLLARAATAGTRRLRLNAEERRALAPFDAGPPAVTAFEAGPPPAGRA